MRPEASPLSASRVVPGERKPRPFLESENPRTLPLQRPGPDLVLSRPLANVRLFIPTKPYEVGTIITPFYREVY